MQWRIICVGCEGRGGKKIDEKECFCGCGNLAGQKLNCGEVGSESQGNFQATHHYMRYICSVLRYGHVKDFLSSLAEPTILLVNIGTRRNVLIHSRSRWSLYYPVQNPEYNASCMFSIGASPHRPNCFGHRFHLFRIAVPHPTKFNCAHGGEAWASKR